MSRKRPKSKQNSNMHRQHPAATAPVPGQQTGASAFDVEYVNSQLAMAGSFSREILENVGIQLDTVRKLQLDLKSPIPGELSRLCDQLRELFGLKPSSAAPAFSAQPALYEFAVKSLVLATRIQELSNQLNELVVAECVKLKDSD